MADLHDLTALEQGDLVRRCEVSPAELADHYLTRIEKLDTGASGGTPLGAFVTVTAQAAHRRAATVGLERPASCPMWGVPTAIKDLNLTAGVRTTFGSAAFSDFVPDVSDNVTLSIESAGMVSLGKTNTPEFGSPCYTEPDVAPPAVTPWDVTRISGGSSGGAATAVAAGLVPVAQGSDGGGSIRIPASCTGLVGFKPSRGVVSGAPVYGDPIGLATAGPIARTVRDAAAFLDVLAGRRVGDPYWAPAPAESYLAAAERPVGRLRIARFVEPVIADVTVDPLVLAAYDDTSRLLEELGHEVEDVAVPLRREAVAVFETCWAVLTALSVVPAEQQSLLRPLTRWLTERGNAVSGPEFGLAVGELRRLAATALTALAPYDAVLTPTVAQLPPRVGELRDDTDPARDFAAQKAFTPWTSAWNVTGMPAVSLPLAWSPEEAVAGAVRPELPIGMMLAGRPGEDGLLLSLAAQLEQARPWGHRRAPLW